MSGHADALVHLLDLEQVEGTIFRGRTAQTGLPRVFGGQVAAQALVAAGRTVPTDRPVHSLHAYFLRPGDPSVPIVYEVDLIRDGRSFTTRRVVAIQHGEAIFHLSASFHVAETGLEHQVDMPDAPDPESLPTFAQRLGPYAEEIGERFELLRPIDFRYVGAPPITIAGGEVREPRQQVWLRTDGELPNDPLLHVCAVTFASDFTLLDSVLLAHGKSWGRGEIRGASLDHAMWFHRPFRADEWLLYDQESATASGGRGLARGHLFGADGRLLVSVVQEGLLRVLTPRP